MPVSVYYSYSSATKRQLKSWWLFPRFLVAILVTVSYLTAAGEHEQAQKKPATAGFTRVSHTTQNRL